VYGFALGDVVEAPESGRNAFEIKRNVERSGRIVIRTWLSGSDKDTWDEVERIIKAAGLQREFRKPSLVAIDAPSDAIGRRVEAQIARLASTGRLEYERGDLEFSPD
jgi:hypothetical protein